jgi:uncharacterized membrane protein
VPKKSTAPRKPRKRKSTSVLALSITVGIFLGIGMGALMNNLLVVILITLSAGAAIGYYIDKKNGISYRRRT